MAMKMSKDWDSFRSVINRLLPTHPRLEDAKGQRALQFEKGSASLSDKESGD